MEPAAEKCIVHVTKPLLSLLKNTEVQLTHTSQGKILFSQDLYTKQKCCLNKPSPAGDRLKTMSGGGAAFTPVEVVASRC